MKPKYLKKKKKSPWGWLIVVAVIVLVIALVIAMMIKGESGAGETTPDTPTTETPTAPTIPTAPVTAQTESETTAIQDNGAVTIVAFENGEIHTPYLTLYYPEAFEDCLLIANSSRDPYVLEFYTVLPEKTEQRIFDVCFGAGTDGNLGVVKTESGEIPVSMTIYSFTPDATWNQGEIDTVHAMQEATNELIHYLDIAEKDSDIIPVLEEEPAETTIVKFLHVETPYCVLQYPAVWAEWLHVEEAEIDGVYRVDYFCSLEGHENLLMFSVLLGGDEGEQLGIVTNTDGITVPVNLLINAPSEDGLNEDEITTLYAMQEAVNQLIAQLPLQ